MSNINRRDFLKIMGKSSMAIALSSYLVPSELSANNGSEFDDFKALVVVDLGGGHDALSMFVPAETEKDSTIGYKKYAQARSEEIRIKDNDMMDDLRVKRGDGKYLNFSGADDNFYIDNGVTNIETPTNQGIYTKCYYHHDKETPFEGKIATSGVMPELANLLDLGQGAVVQNVGSIKALYTKDDLRKDSDKKPPFIGSHDESTVLVKTGQATTIYSPYGWLGRLADSWSGLNSPSVHKMNINLSKFGNNKMLHGASTSGFNIGSAGPTDFEDLDKADYDAIAKITENDTSNDKFEKLYAESRVNIYENLGTLLSDWSDVTGAGNPFVDLKDSYGNDIFDDVDSNQHFVDDGINGGVIQNFSTAARLIYNAKKKGDKRVVISISLGGFDTHSKQHEMHVNAYRGLSIALDKFTRAMDHLKLSDSVTTFNISEFGRTVVSNGNGTDHGWGSSFFVLGGAVKPGNYGTFPDLTPGSQNDFSTKGRLIPTTSFTQYYATILKWFGADEATLHEALPELVNFPDKEDLGFMKTV